MEIELPDDFMRRINRYVDLAHGSHLPLLHSSIAVRMAPFGDSGHLSRLKISEHD